MRLAVIGAMGAGLSAALRARRTDPSSEVLVLERGEVISYAACGLPYYVEGRVAAPTDLVARTAEALERDGVRVRTQTAVAEIRHPRRELLLTAASAWLTTGSSWRRVHGRCGASSAPPRRRAPSRCTRWTTPCAFVNSSKPGGPAARW
jgi:NADPH-dependent 2,4-dienoyl-CoA reductase/sulfur reductase-like enzyme